MHLPALTEHLVRDRAARLRRFGVGGPRSARVRDDHGPQSPRARRQPGPPDTDLRVDVEPSRERAPVGSAH